MEKARRLASGSLSEILGPDTVEVDKFMRSIGLRRLAEESYKLMTSDEQDVLQAYTDGVNDFVSGVDFYSSEATARMLPPEFIVFGIDKETYQLWSPIDSITISKLMAF